MAAGCVSSRIRACLRGAGTADLAHGLVGGVTAILPHWPSALDPGPAAQRAQRGPPVHAIRFALWGPIWTYADTSSGPQASIWSIWSRLKGAHRRDRSDIGKNPHQGAGLRL